MQTLAQWAAMGGYAGYVWTAYGIALIVLGGIGLQSWWQHRASSRALDRLQSRADLRR